MREKLILRASSRCPKPALDFLLSEYKHKQPKQKERRNLTMPRRDRTGPPSGSRGPRDGSGGGKAAPQAKESVP